MANSNRSEKNKPDARSLIDRLAAEEEKFVSQPFLAPSLPGGEIQVKIGGVVCKIKTAPADFEGFGIFHPISFTEAVLEREATLAERKKYLELFPDVRLIATRRVESGWLATAANRGDNRFQIDGLVPIKLVTDIRLFDVLVVRFDGAVFWFEQTDTRFNPRHADYLRKSLDARVEPAELSFSGLSAEHRAAYEFNYWLLVNPPARPTAPENARRPGFDPTINFVSQDPNENRLRDSLSHAGAELIDYAEQQDAFQVAYRVDGRRYTSAVDKDNLTLISAGICLDGYDANFDLTSLVGVLREGRDHGEF